MVLLPDCNKVYTPDGIKSLRDLTLEDSVLGGDGMFRRLTQIQKQSEYTGDIAKFNWGGNESAYLLPGSRILATLFTPKTTGKFLVDQNALGIQNQLYLCAKDLVIPNHTYPIQHLYTCVTFPKPWQEITKTCASCSLPHSASQCFQTYGYQHFLQMATPADKGLVTAGHMEYRTNKNPLSLTSISVENDTIVLVNAGIVSTE